FDVVQNHRFAFLLFFRPENWLLERINMSLLRSLRVWGVLRFLQTCRSSGAISFSLKKFGVPQIIAYSAGRDLQISTFSVADLQIGIWGSEDPRPGALRSEDRTQQYH